MSLREIMILKTEFDGFCVKLGCRWGTLDDSLLYTLRYMRVRVHIHDRT